MTTYVGVVGASDPTDDQLRLARAVGELLAERGAVLVCGGLGGVMEAACQGAYEAGGTTVGLLPDADRRRANQYLTVSLPTGLGEARNGLIIRAAQAVIGIGSGWGTLSELALAGRAGVPVFLLDSWSTIVDASGRETSLGQVVRHPIDAVTRALAAIGGEG